MEWLRHRGQLVDALTRLPTLPAVIQDARQLLTKGGALDVLYVDLGRSGIREARMGWEAYDRVIHSFSECIEQLRRENRLTSEEIACVRTSRSDRFVLFLAVDPRAPAADSRQSRAAGVLASLREISSPGMDAFSGGYSRVLLDPMIRGERAIQRAITRAMLHCFGARGERRVERLRALDGIITHGAVRVVFQPVGRLDNKLVLGHEALSRHDEESLFDSVDDLFGFAESTDRQLDLERVCRIRAILSASKRSAPGFLFLNSSSLGVGDPEWLSPQFTARLAENGLVPNQVVVEVPERMVTESGLAFRRAIKALKAAGYRLAIDDMGAGYATFQTLAELEPDFLKLDVGLVRGAQGSRIKRDLAVMLGGLANKLGARVIAEGVETEPEAQMLRDLGVGLGQGKLFSGHNRERDA